jgi:predicted RNA polymerase sigma factor
MHVVYLIFNEGHTATSGPHVNRADLADEAIRLARQLHERLPDQPGTSGLLALLLLTDARRPARHSADGELVPLDQQDRRLWRRPLIVEGLCLLTAALTQHSVGPYQLEAAIAAVHAQAPSYGATDWTQLRALYNQLARRGDNPLVRLNRAVAVAHTDGPKAAQRELDVLGASLADSHRYHATVGYLHELAGEHSAARHAYGKAAHLAANEPERRYLQRKAEPEARPGNPRSRW